MRKDNDKDLTGHPSDYGGRTLELEEGQQRTADGEPRVERGTADSAISREKNAEAQAPRKP
jgi:hypothetical protein